MTRKEILLDTFRYYEEDPSRRALNGNSGIYGPKCVYHTAAGNMCAVGRMFNWKKIDELKLNRGFINKGGEVHFIARGLSDRGVNIQDIFKAEVQNHSLLFWADLQRFHDTPGFWIKADHSDSSREEYKQKLLDTWS